MATVGGPVAAMRPSTSDTDIFGSTYNLRWLFDPDRIDHLPIPEQLKLFKQRDLKKTKIFKIASNIWGGPLSRKRLCIAPPMYESERGEVHPYASQQMVVTSDLKPQKPVPIPPTKEELKEAAESDRLVKYKNWVNERKSFRANLDTMGLTEEYLEKKPNRTALESRVLRRMLEEKYPRVSTPPPREDTPQEAILPDDAPTVQRPSPLAIRIMERFLHEKKMRLIDLFAIVDKDKNWKVSREEFRTAIKKAQIPISEVLLEDLILTLDTDLSDELDYRELAKGMGLWRIEKRENKRKLLSSASFSSSPSKFSQMSGFLSPEKPEKGPSARSLARSKSSPTPPTRSPSPLKEAGRDTRQDASRSTARIKSALSTISSTSSSRNLEPPVLDLRPEVRVCESEEAMVDLRKRDRESLARLTGAKKDGVQKSILKKTLTTEADGKTMVKTGERAVDDHMMPSTMEGRVAEQVDRFRQLRFQEYHQICELCKDRNVPLTEPLLQKVLMYPPDRPHAQIRKHVRQPAMPLHSEGFAEPKVDKNKPVTPSPDAEEASKQVTKVKVSKEGKVQVFVDSRRAYPPRSKVAAVPAKMNLSSGKAVVRRKVNCWLTYEEYERLTRKFTTRYIDLHGSSDDNAFWPGHLLDKVALCMPNPEPLTSSVFRSTRQPQRSNYGYNNDLNTHPVNEKGFVQYGGVDRW